MPACLPQFWKYFALALCHQICFVGNSKAKAFVVTSYPPSTGSRLHRLSQLLPSLKRPISSTSISVSLEEENVSTDPIAYDDGVLIPREHLFENPDFRDPAISPDGKHIAYLAPHPTDGSFPYIYILPVSSLSDKDEDRDGSGDIHRRFARRVTDGGARGLAYFFWGEDSKTIFYLQDKKGFENYHLWAVDIIIDYPTPGINGDSTNDEHDDEARVFIKPARDLTPGGGDLKVQQVFKSPFHPDQLLVTTNQRDKTLFDVYRCKYTRDSSTLVLDTINPGNIVGWGAIATEDMFEVCRALVRCQEDASTTLLIRNSIHFNGKFAQDRIHGSDKTNNNDDDDFDWRELYTWPYGEDGSFIEFLKDENACLLTSSVDRDTTALLKVDLSTGEILEEMFRHEQCDVGKVILDPETNHVRAVSYTYARTEWSFWDPDLEAHFEELSTKIAFSRTPTSTPTPTPPETMVDVRNKSKDENLWLVALVRSDAPTQFYLYDCITKTAKSLFCARPILLNYKLAPMECVQITARDGLELVGYLTRSKGDRDNTNGGDGGGDGTGTSTSTSTSTRNNTTKTPLILLVHGGPWDRDHWGFNPTSIWFANRGYATLSINFRGSAGFGKKFKNLGDQQWGVGTMQHDLTDAVQWAINEGIADADRVCIYGGSYGGYCVLAGLAFTPDLYRCGVDMVGPSNVKTLLDSIPSYWNPLRNQMLRRIGNVDDDPAFNEKISPLFHVDQIKSPLMIAHGAKDVRVTQRESDQIAFSMKEKGIPISYVVYPNEGHGIRRPPNRVDFIGRVEVFLQEHLGGRAQAFHVPAGSSAYFPLDVDMDGDVDDGWMNGWKRDEGS